MWPIELLHTYLPSPVFLQIGEFGLRWYGLFMALGLAVGFGLTRRGWRERGWAVTELESLVFWLVIAGLLGARLLDVFFYEWWYFKDQTEEIFYLWRGGLAWHGGLLAGWLVLVAWARKHQRSVLSLVDVFVPGLAIGQAIGRWGNYFNQELFGRPTALPWGIPIAAANRPLDLSSAVYFHPVFLYEFIGLLVIGLTLWYGRKKPKIKRNSISLYLLLTGSLRLGLESIRLDEQNLYLGWRAGWWAALFTVITGALIWLWKSRLSKKENPAQGFL